MKRPLAAAGVLLAAFLLILPARAVPSRPTRPTVQEDVPIPTELPEDLGGAEQPWAVRMMIHELRRGMFIALPVVDTNPNKGTTYGMMPIWVLQSGADKRIQFIHAPSITYNPTFRWEATTRHYWYPSEDAIYFVRAALSGNVNKDVIGEMADENFLGKGFRFNARLVYDNDASKRFFGLGPASAEADESNYLRKTVGYRARVGLPIFKKSDWRFNIGHQLAGEKIVNGVFETLPGIRTRFPGQSGDHFHQNSEITLGIDYDTRDSAVTTTKGLYASASMEHSQRPFGSEFTFQRYGIDLRAFQPWPKWPFTSAFRFRYDQVLGEAPFYLLPSLGGKRTSRAYVAGRFIDKGMMTTTLEHRIIAHKVEFAGVTTELEITPFIGLGSVFSSPKRLAQRYMRPVYGTAFRAIARPQVVGSIDLGLGQEGGSVFMDINYSF